MTVTEFTDAIGYDCVTYPNKYDAPGAVSLEGRQALVSDLAATFGWKFRGFFHDAARPAVKGATLPGFDAALAMMTPQTVLIIYDPDFILITEKTESQQQFFANKFDKIVTERGGTYKTVKQLVDVRMRPSKPFSDYPGIKAIGYVRGWPRSTQGDPISIQNQVDEIRKEAAAAGWDVPVIYEDQKNWDLYPDPADPVRNELTIDRPGLTAALSELTPGHVLIVMRARNIGAWRIMASFEDAIERAGAQWITTAALNKRFKNFLYIQDVYFAYNRRDEIANELCCFCEGPIINNRYDSDILCKAFHENENLGLVCDDCWKLSKNEREFYAMIDFVKYPKLVGARITVLGFYEPDNYVPADNNIFSQPDIFLPGGPPGDSYSR